MGRPVQLPATTKATERWLTPLSIIDPLGRFDLDPCGAPGHDTADRVYLLENGDDGLRDPWEGRVWLNPPYGSEAVKWLRRLADHDGGGIALIFARTDTAAFHEVVWGRASAILFMRGRLTFMRPDGTAPKANAGAPSCLVAYGDNEVSVLSASGIPGHLVDLR